MKTILASILLICALQGCINKKKTDAFCLKPNSQVDISYRKLALDSIPLDTVTTSYVLESGLHDNYIYVLDRNVCALYQYDFTGKLIDKKLGQGRGRNETSIGQIASHTFLSDGDLVLLDYNGCYTLYDKNFMKKDYIRVSYNRDKKDKKTPEERYRDPYSYSRMYECLVCRSYGKDIYFNVDLSDTDCGYIPTTDLHLEKKANIVEMDLESKKFGRLLAIGYPKSYKENPLKKALFSSVTFDVSDSGDFYVSYQADSLIYHYNHDYTELECFGFAGKDMKQDYVEITNFDVMGKHYMSELKGKGYYNWLEYVDETGMLFRSYQKGGNSSTDGLQIYKDGVLIGDVSVPKGFKVMGYVAPYYYSYVIADEKRELMYLYRFKL